MERWVKSPWWMVSLVAACASQSGMEDRGGDGAELVGRWAGRTEITDFAFASGRGVPVDEIFALDAGGEMRADVAGMDASSGCAVTYALRGSWRVDSDGALDATWSSIVGEVVGCDDPSNDRDAAELISTEGALWDDELGGAWTLDGDQLTLVGIDGTVAYTRVRSDLVARWVGSSTVDDFTFAEGRDVVLDEVFWLNADASMRGFFHGVDEPSGCQIDYRLSGRWTEDASGAIEASWTSLFASVRGCGDPSLDYGWTDVTADESEIWNTELTGTWTVDGADLTIANDAGGAITYRRAL